MLEKLQIQNYRCFRKVNIPLRPLTVLVGPNDSGKTAALRALQFLADARSLEDFDWWRGNRQHFLSVKGRAVEISIERNSNNPAVTGPTGPNPLKPTQLFQLPSDGVPMVCQGLPDTSGPPIIGPHGENVPALLDYLHRCDEERFNGIVKSMRRLVAGLEEIKIANPDAPLRRVDFVVDGQLLIPADNASVGVRLLLFFVALAHHPTPPKLILIEEPENSVHPKRLEDVVQLLREITEGKHGNHAAQVVLTTHSPHLLDHIDPNKDQVLVFRREDDGSRTAEPADTERLKNFLDEFMLGEVWYNEGEAGLVKRAK